MPTFKPGLTDKSRVKILTVDPTTRRIEAALKDGSLIHIAVWDPPTAFRWPQENEIWIVRRDNGYWMLDRRAQTGGITTTNGVAVVEPEVAPVEQMNPGDLKLDAGTVINANGLTFVAVDLSGIMDGWTLRWSSTLKRFVAGP